jgi:D-alanyl-D-alanine carboxypeptidase/D-alanyl-D-alanine-endopeptidase (penicillin-binding protein 4)
VVHPASGDTLFSHNAAQLLVPASNTKIVTGAVALATLGPDYRWTTRVSSTGELRNGVISGNLVVTGRGDPTVSSRLRGDAMTPLREMADSLAARGIRRIAGRIVKGGDAFPDANIGPGWQWDYLASGYAAGVDELFFNEGTVRIVVRGAPVAGAPPAIITSPARSFPLVKVLALTRQPVDSVRTRIALQVDSGGVGVTVTGYIAPGDSSVQTVVLQDPATAYLFALREALSEKGITVDSAVSAGSVVTDARGMSTLFDYYSAPFREVLAEMMKPSQNQLAEIFLRTVGLEGTGVGSADSGARVVRRQLLEWGVAPDGFALRDGSGLTRNNFISPESITRVLHAMRGHPLYTVFFDALPIAGVDGTLRSRMSGTPAERNLRGKTGTLARASALSGYVRTLDGQELIFSTVCNNFTASADAVVGMQNRIGVILASLDWTR